MAMAMDMTTAMATAMTTVMTAAMALCDHDHDRDRDREDRPSSRGQGGTAPVQRDAHHFQGTPSQGKTKAGADLTRTGRGPDARHTLEFEKRNGCGPDADRPRAWPFLPGEIGGT
eukprot:gene24733-biopygen14971